MGSRRRSLGIATESLEMRRGVPDPRGLLAAGPAGPGVAARRGAQPHGPREPDGAGAPAACRSRRCVSTIHNIYEGGPLRMAAYRLTNGLVDHMTIISQAAADRFVGERIVPRRLLTVIPNGVDTERMRELPPGPGRAAAVPWASERVRVAGGRAVRGREGLSQHAAGVRSVSGERQPRACCCWSGQGSLQAETEALAPSSAWRGGALPRRPRRRAGAS